MIYNESVQILESDEKTTESIEMTVENWVTKKLLKRIVFNLPNR